MSAHGKGWYCPRRRPDVRVARRGRWWYRWLIAGRIQVIEQMMIAGTAPMAVPARFSAVATASLRPWLPDCGPILVAAARKEVGIFVPTSLPTSLPVTGRLPVVALGICSCFHQWLVVVVVVAESRPEIVEKMVVGFSPPTPRPQPLPGVIFCRRRCPPGRLPTHSELCLGRK